MEKVIRYEGEKQYRLRCDAQGYEQRRILNEKISPYNMSLLQIEIDILKPDIVIFAVGPNNPYFRALHYAFDLNEGTLNDYFPTAENPCKEISQILGLDMPAYWTYHPNFLSRNGLFKRVIEEITRLDKQTQ